MLNYKYDRPKAITMWDFSWLERRWTGAGYESWEEALDGLVLRGYDAVRIDAYPHLFAADPEKEWTLNPEWDQQIWGAPAITRVKEIKKNLIEFISLCRDRNIAVGLSSWFREDVDNTRMTITTPERFAEIWCVVLEAIAEAGLIDAILYVDLCNEYPLDCWAMFLRNDREYKKMVANWEIREGDHMPLSSEIAMRWLNISLEIVRKAYPEYDYTFSGGYDGLSKEEVSVLDFLEPHIWMTTCSDFYKRVGYNFERFDSKGYINVALHAEDLYKSNPEHWDGKLCDAIARTAEYSRNVGKPLMTTECWGIVDYKDWPLLNWDWVKHLCALGTEKAAAEGRWIAISTSNFCGPQFVGMWRDVEWHQRLTNIIKNSKLPG